MKIQDNTVITLVEVVGDRMWGGRGGRGGRGGVGGMEEVRRRGGVGGVEEMGGVGWEG